MTSNLKMHRTWKSWREKCVPDVELTCGIVIILSVSCVLSVLTNHFDVYDHFSLDSNDVIKGHVYKLFTYCLYHKNMTSLILDGMVMVYPCVGMEKGMGTIRFLHQSLLLSSMCGLLHVLLESLLFSSSNRSPVNGLVPLALSFLGMVTVQSAMRKAYFMGINVPTVSLPWIFLTIVTVAFPNTVFLCNVLAIIVGILHGKGRFSLFEISESRASVLEKKFPFRLLKHVPGVQFISASAEERNKPLDLTDITPGSYPVQTYAPVNPGSGQTTGNLSNSLDGWPHSSYPRQNYTFPSPYTGGSGVTIDQSHGHGHSHGQGHSHSHQCAGAHHYSNPRISPYTQTQIRPPFKGSEEPFSHSPQPGASFTPQTSHVQSNVHAVSSPPGTSVLLTA